MKYEPWEIIEASFRKHMQSSEYVQKKYDELKKEDDPYFHYSSAEEYYDGQMHHNFEYFKWYIERDTGKVIFDRHEVYEPLGLFYGQTAAVTKIKEDLVDYVLLARSFLEEAVISAIAKLSAQRVEAEEIQLPNNKNGYDWGSLLGIRAFGLRVVTGKPARVLSSSKYGRFIEIEGLE